MHTRTGIQKKLQKHKGNKYAHRSRDMRSEGGLNDAHAYQERENPNNSVFTRIEYSPGNGGLALSLLSML